MNEKNRGIITIVILIVMSCFLFSCFGSCFGRFIDDDIKTETDDVEAESLSTTNVATSGAEKEETTVQEVLQADDYISIYEPVCVEGNMNLYKYSDNSSPWILGGHEYKGGLTVSVGTFIDEGDRPCVEFPLSEDYDWFSFVLCGHGQSASDDFEKGKPTVIGSNSESDVVMQILVDDEVFDEFEYSDYDPERRFTVPVTGAEKVTVKVTSGDCGFKMYLFEITAGRGENVQIAETSGSEAVKLVRDLRPYLIPGDSSFSYCLASDNDVKPIYMDSAEYSDAMYCTVSSALIGTDFERIMYDLDGNYNVLQFTAGALDSNENAAKGCLIVYADGAKILEENICTGEAPKTYTVDVTGCHRLEFSCNIEEGGRESIGIADAYAAVDEKALEKAKE